jgi:hypothetical protein
MNDVRLLHTPKWQLCGVNWHLIVGNHSVAKIKPNFDRHFLRYEWVSIIDCKNYIDHGWDAVDFETLEMAKYDIEQWWHHMCRGEAFRP